MKEKQIVWASRIGFILAAMGMAIGTGNIWRFPRMVAMNGGGSFLIGWAIFLLVWSLPLIMVEVLIGRKTRMGTVGSFRAFVGEKYAWMGGMITWVAMWIAFYYSVVVGWTLKYLALALMGEFKSGIDTQKLWDTFTANATETIGFHLLSITLCGFILFKGINSGIERISKIFLPLLFVMLIFTTVFVLQMDGAIQGVTFMFTPDWTYLGKAETWLQALSQSAWSTGAGWGLYATYAIYTRKKEDIAQNALTAGLGNNSVELLAGLTIIPAIFILSPSQEYMNQAMSSDNTGLTFVYMVNVFSTMPGGYWFGIAFFFALAFAAITSLMALVEFVVRNLSDLGLPRKKAILTASIITFAFGIPSAVSMDFFGNQDWVWGIGLLFSAFFYYFVAVKYGVERIRDEINEVSDIHVGRLWVWSIKYCIPVIFIIFLGWWIYQSITWYPDTWWSPFEVSSVGTIALQLGIGFAVVWLSRSWVRRQLRCSAQDEGLELEQEMEKKSENIKGVM